MAEEVKTREIKVALAGNPNVGKSVIFHELTGVYVDVSNYPGTTIEIASAEMIRHSELSEKTKSVKPGTVFKITDTPGVYGISSFNDEERAARDYILEADLVINVVSSTTLSRDLFLTKQLTDLGKPMIIALNQYDEAQARKVDIDIASLREELGIDIITCVAVKGQGIPEIKTVIESINSPLGKLNPNPKAVQIKTGNISKDIDVFLSPYVDRVLSRAEALMIAEGDEYIAKQNAIELDSNTQKRREDIYQIRREEVNNLVAKTVSKKRFSKRVFLGKLLLNPFIGGIVAVLTLYLFLYQFLGVFIAGTVVDFAETNIFNAYYEPFIRGAITKVLPIVHNNIHNLVLTNPAAALGTFLAGDYGVLTLTITYLYGLLMPLVFGFYFGLALLEDSGYLPRLAVLCDGLLTRLGMNGRAIIPLILGGGCVTMAVVTTRLLSSEKEKLITMALLGLTIPCSAQLGVIQGLLSNIGGISPWLIWGGTLFVIFGLTGLAMNKIIDGDCGNFISDIPPLRFPRLSNIFNKTFTRSKIFMDEATSAFFIAAAVVAGMQVSGVLEITIKAFEPIISDLLLLPKEVALSFILGMVRRDFGAFGLLDIEMTSAQLITSCLVLTLFVPCIATVAVMIKEKNFKTALGLWLMSWALAFLVGGIMARVLNYIA